MTWQIADPISFLRNGIRMPRSNADVKSRSLDQYIVKIRTQFGNHGLNLDTFRTVHGVGYIFDPAGVSTEGR